MFAAILFFLLFNGSKSVNAIDNCQGNKYPGNWTCSRNTDGTLNVTLDCNFNKNKSVDLWLWSEKFPPRMKVLTIKNCDEVNVANVGDYNTTKTFKEYFSHLQIVNVSHLTLVNKNPERELVGFGYRTLPRNVIFKDIKLIMSPLPSLNPFSSNEKADSLKFINATIVNLGSIVTYRFKELIIKNITISEESYMNLINSYDEKAVIKIINSTFNKPLTQFLHGKVGKLIIQGNIFKEISSGAFQCTADEFVFSENQVKILPSVVLPWGDKNWRINTRVAQIEGNTFDSVGDYGFYGIGTPSSNTNRRIFSFSKNLIRKMQSKALEFQFRETYSNSVDIYNVSDNLLVCVCDNIPWFYLNDLDMNNSWFNSKNRNRCSNIPNCLLHQIHSNFYDLCLEDYQCPVNASEYSKKPSSDHKDLSDSVNASQDLKNPSSGSDQQALKDLSDSVKEMLDILTIIKNDAENQIESKGIAAIIVLCAIVVLISCSVCWKCAKKINFPQVRRHEQLQLESTNHILNEAESSTSLIL